jgi:hypothetical protein
MAIESNLGKAAQRVRIHAAQLESAIANRCTAAGLIFERLVEQS